MSLAPFTPLPVRFVEPRRLSVGARVGVGMLSAACLLVLVLAARLTPNPTGLGTHRGLGLPECGFLEATGLPCPSCGMTTSFAWFVRGNLLASVYVQPMGAMLAALCGLGVWAGAFAAFTGTPLHRLLATIPSRTWAVPLLSLAITAWGWKMYLHVHGIDGWR